MSTTLMRSSKYCRLSFFVVLVTILASNVFSPQFLIWLAPFAPFLTSLEAGLLVVASLLTFLYFRVWEDVVRLQPMAVSLLLLRNFVLVVLAFVVLRNLVSSRQKVRVK